MSEDNKEVVDNVVQESQSEVEARQFGWMPKEEFKGDPEQWRDAETFLQRGKEINGFLRKDLEKLEQASKRKDAELAEIRRAMEEFKQFHNKSIEATYKQAIEDLKNQKAQAIEEGDGKKVVEIDEEISKYKEAQRPIQEDKTPVSKPDEREYYEWLDTNQWYITDEKKSKAAEKFGDILLAKNPNLKGREFLDAVTQKVKEAFSEDFENPARNNSQVAGNSDGIPRGNTSANRKSYNNLPQEAKEACDRFVKMKIMTREQYVNEFDWS